MVLELTLKHVKALSTLLEQQQQKIIALQKDLQISKFDGVMCRRQKADRCFLFIPQSVASIGMTSREIVLWGRMLTLCFCLTR